MRNENGFAVPLAILVIVALGLVGGAAAFMSAGDTNVATLYAVANQTADAAGAGLEHAVAKYDDRVAAYSSGDFQSFILAGGWPLSASLDGYAYTVDVKRDSFDFDDDGDLEPVSCKPNEDQDTGNGNGGNGGGNGNGNEDDSGDDVGDGTDIGEAPGGDSGDYWEDPSGKDKNGDGQTGLSGGHFDVDVFQPGNQRKYHQHEFDDKYDTTKTELVDDPHLLWEDYLSSAGNVTVSFNNVNNAPGWHRIDLVNGTRVQEYNKDAAPMTLNANQIEGFRIQYTNLTGFSCTDPGAVKNDATSRSGAFTIYIHDESTGALLYEFAVYWHNKNDDCVPEDDGDVETPDKGDSKDATDLNEDDEKAAKYCSEWAKKYAEYESKMAEAQELKEKAEAKEAEGKKADGEWKKYYKKLEEAQKKYDESVVKCDLAHDFGSCDCSTEQTDTGSDDGGEDGGGGNTTTVGPCILNGDDDGEPVFLFTSIATRGAFQASQRMTVTTDDNRTHVWRIAWLAD